MDIDRASGTCAWLLHLLPGDKSPGYKIARSDAASCLNNSRASLDTICERWLNLFSGCGCSRRRRYFSTYQPSLQDGFDGRDGDSERWPIARALRIHRI